MLVLGIDPGTATTGFGLVESQKGRERLVAFGTFNTAASLTMPERLLIIHRELQSLLNEYQPEAMAIEQLFFNKNSKTALSVAQSRGVMLMTAAQACIGIAEYTPLQVKQAVVGYGSASKKQVQLMVQAILSMTSPPRPDDAADALAIAICHLHSRRINALYESES